MIPKTITELNWIREECKSMVSKRATTSAVVAVVPVPGVDVAADVAIMMELFPAINRKFGLSPVQIDQLDSAMKAKILVFITSTGSKLVGKVITKELIVNLLKKIGVRVTVSQVAQFVPFIGQAVSSGINFGAMKHLGNSHIDECYSVCKRVIDMQQT